MKSFLLPVGTPAGAALPAFLSALSCGAALPVSGLDILHIADSDDDPVLRPLIRDYNRMHALLGRPDNDSLFPSSFEFDSCRPALPSLHHPEEDPAASALIGALRGKGVPLSYKTDREAVEWAFSMLLSGRAPDELSPFFSWLGRIDTAAGAGEPVRVAVVCDLCDPFSAGAAFVLLRFIRNTARIDSGNLAFFCLGIGSGASPEQRNAVLAESLDTMNRSSLAGRPDQSASPCADAVWFLSAPAAMCRGPESLRLLYAVLAREASRFLVSEKTVPPGLHTVTLPGTLTFHSLDAQSHSFASFLHSAVWFMTDLFPALSDYCSRSASLRSRSPGARKGFLRRLFRNEPASQEQLETLAVVKRAFTAVLSEVLALIRFLPDHLRLSEISDLRWQQIVDACGRTVTVASEYAVSMAEAEESGILDVKPVHRVSMADTAEEKAGRRLEEIASQLKSEKETRDSLLRSFGGCWRIPAVSDCLSRCRQALDRALEQQQSGEAGADRLSSAALSRRIRLLQAAVDYCRGDLQAAELSGPGPADSPETADRPSPFSGQLLNAEASEKLFTLLVAQGDSAEAARKELSASLPSVLYGFTLSDTKTLSRRLLSACKASDIPDPFACLLLSVLEVSRGEIRPLRFLSSGSAPSVPLLPDLYPSAPLLTVSSLVSLLPAPGQDIRSESEKRGVLAALLLRQYRRRNFGDAALLHECFRKGQSPVLDAWLLSHHADHVWIVSLSGGGQCLPFALILPGAGLIPAHFTASHLSLLPSYAALWFDEETLSFRDPCALMSEGDALVMREQLASITQSHTGELSPSLSAFLTAFLQDLESVRQQSGLPDQFTLRLKAAYGLRLLPAFSQSLVRTSYHYERSLSSDDIAARLLGRDSFPPCACDVPDDIVFTYRDVPFAREDSRKLLDTIPLPAEGWILSLLDKECQILSGASDDYHDLLVRELSELLQRHPDALPEARDAVSGLLGQAAAPVADMETELVWPWDPKSPSVLTILSESVGASVAASALEPFSDLLVLFPARGLDVIGDSLMAAMCILPAESLPEADGEVPSVQPDSVLPPLSPDFCAALCRLPEGRTLVRQNLLSLERVDSGAIRASITLEGSFTVRLVRNYEADEIIRLYSHDIPTLAVWPNLPFLPEDWHAYFIYAGLPSSLRFTAFCADGGSVPSGGGGRAVCRTVSFPLSFTFFREEKSLGSLPNLLPSPVIEKAEPYTACIDFGSVGSSVVFSAGRRRLPMQGPTMVRTLLNNPARSRDLLRKEFLPAVPVSALLPSASRLFRNRPGEAPLPFEDGIILMSSDLQDVLSVPSGALYTCLKWEEDKGRSVTLCLHQVMLMAALQARSGGASALLWRFAVPDDMAKSGRERLAALFASLAEKVNAESGFGIPEKSPLVTYAAESSALGAYFRFCASEDTRGGFMVLDIGACTADLSLFLRGREQAVRTCQIPLGIHYMLLPSLLRNPDLLLSDLSFIQDPACRNDLALLGQIIRNAKADPSALRHSRLALDNFIADRYASLLPVLLQSPVTGMPSKTGSLLLLHFSFLMMLSGLILQQISADPGKNDFLPEQMSLFLAGRGSLLAEYLPDHYKSSLWHFLTMFRNRRVASLSLLFSSEKKMEIPVGLSFLQSCPADLPSASAIPAAIPVRPEELLPQFLLRFAREFPASAEILFHGFFTGDFYHPFTSYGESVVSEAITEAFTERTSLRPFDALSAWIGSLLELIDASVS